MENEREELEKGSRFQAFSEEYLTRKNVLVGLGVASLAGVAAYSTVRVLKNEKLMGRIKQDLNFDAIKKNITNGLDIVGDLGSRLFEKKEVSKNQGRASVKPKATAKSRSKVKSKTTG